jgi:hypothetical protein
MSIQVCPFHSNDEVHGVPIGDEAHTESFTCSREDHPRAGAWTWSWAPDPPGGDAVSGLAAELSLDFELPKAVASYDGRWVEYGLVERAYALAQPEDFRRLVERFGHTHREDSGRYSVSAYLARTLGDLSRVGSVLFHQGSGTGRWSYNSGISYWAVPPEPDWDSRLSWEDAGPDDMGYVPPKS